MTNTAVYKMTQMNLRSSWVKWHRDLSEREEGWRNGGGRTKGKGSKGDKRETARVIDLREAERTHTHGVGCYGWYDQLLLFCYFW